MTEYNELIEERKRKVIHFLKTKPSWIAYAVLAMIVWLATYVRTRGLPGLRDITTGDWTLGPDLDPFLFLRYAKDILQHGFLMSIDSLRYVPLGYQTSGESILLPYLIAWFHKIAFAMGITTSVNHSAALFPVFMFMITVVAFFLFVRRAFSKTFEPIYSNSIALISCLFLSVIPVLLPRTIAGIPEKESVAFFFMFMSLYFFVSGWQSGSFKKSGIFGVLSGIFGAGMALVWGGYSYLVISIGSGIMIAYLTNQIDKKRLVLVTTWVLSMYLVMNLVSTRYSLSALITSTTTIFPLAIIFVAAVNCFSGNLGYGNYIKKIKFLSRVPDQVVYLIIVAILGIIAGTIFFGPGFILHVAGDISGPLLTPVSDRLGVTVAENQQPFLTEWNSNFGPFFGKIPIFFWIMFIGSIYLFYEIVSEFSKKERYAVTGSFALFLFALIFSRYSSNSVFNGTNFISVSFYFLGISVFVLTAGAYYYKKYKNGQFESLKLIHFEYVLIFCFLLLSFISARGAVRVILVLVPPASIVVSLLVVSLIRKAFKNENHSRKIIYYVVIGLLLVALLYSAYYFYKSSYSISQSYIPSQYTNQWQKAMQWVRENTSENAVFGHWWDYGYWVQSLGERATVLDGGNVIPYWNHLMGRYTLTGDNSKMAAEFLYSHNATHFLIDSSDIGKYTAFSSIGSDENYDRRSWISSFMLDDSQTHEEKNSTTLLYRGGFTLDEDISYSLNGTVVLLPGVGSSSLDSKRSLAGLGGAILNRNSQGKYVSAMGVFVYQGKQITLPIRYLYQNKTLTDFGKGVEAGMFLMDRVDQQPNGQISIVHDGAMLYLSRRVLVSQLGRLYLFRQEDPYFKIVHIENDQVVNTLRSQGYASDEFIFYQGVRGPISIWNIRYPGDMRINEEFLKTSDPNKRLVI